MQHSIAAKFVARPTSRFPRPAGSERERRLGLRSALSFQPAAARLTVLRATRGGLQLNSWRPVAASRAGLHSGVIRPTVAICWAGGGRVRPDRQSSLAPAPWRG